MYNYACALCTCEWRRYNASGGGTWTPHDLRLFLLDLQEALGQPRVVPEEAMADVLRELQLNIDAPGGVSWVEFKRSLFFRASPL